MVDVVDDGDGSLTGSRRVRRKVVYRKKASAASRELFWQCKLKPYAVPFFWLIRSVISRFKARLGSKLEGSQAFPGDEVSATAEVPWWGGVDSKGSRRSLLLHTYESFDLRFRVVCGPGPRSKAVSCRHSRRCVLQVEPVGGFGMYRFGDRSISK